MMTFSKNRAIALGLATAMSVAAAPSLAAPVLSSTASVKESAPAQTTEIQWRGRRGGAVAAGAAVGFLAGAAIGSAAAQQRYYNDPYYAYAPGPTYYEPAPSYYYAEPAPTYYVDPGYAYAPAPVYSYPRRGYSNLCRADNGIGIDTSKQC